MQILIRPLPARLQPELIVKSKETEELLAQVAQDQENADRVKKMSVAMRWFLLASTD